MLKSNICDNWHLSGICPSSSICNDFAVQLTAKCHANNCHRKLEFRWKNCIWITRSVAVDYTYYPICLWILTFWNRHWDYTIGTIICRSHHVFITIWTFYRDIWNSVTSGLLFYILLHSYNIDK